MTRKLFFWWRYLLGKAPWDTGITPPEIVALIEGEKLPVGRALDLGCGTGTNVIYLAQHGWLATGIDYVAKPIRLARRKARRSGVADRVHFIVGDVSRLADYRLDGPFDLVTDVGCGHALDEGDRAGYVESVARLMKPGGVWMVYWFCGLPGTTPEEVNCLFSPYFELVWQVVGEDSSAQMASAWYRFKRNG